MAFLNVLILVILWEPVVSGLGEELVLLLPSPAKYVSEPCSVQNAPIHQNLHGWTVLAVGLQSQLKDMNASSFSPRFANTSTHCIKS